MIRSEGELSEVEYEKHDLIRTMIDLGHVSDTRLRRYIKNWPEMRDVAFIELQRRRILETY